MKKTITKVLSVVLVVALTISAAPLSGLVGIELPEWFDFSIMSSAAEYTSGDYTYTLSSDNKATITKAATSLTGEVVIPETIDEYPVVAIGSSAFYNCAKITSVTISSSVTRINDYAFRGCTRLASIDLANIEYLGDNIFNGCTSLTSLTIPNTLTSVSSNGPLVNSNVRTVVFEEGILNIPAYMCYNCKTITSVTLPENKDLVDGYKIGSYAFAYTAISSIELPESITEIGSSAFCGCASLTGIEIKDNVTTIGTSAFNGCSKLSSAVIGTSVTKINDYAFSGCSRLASIDLVNVEYLGDNIFNGCTSLTSLTIPNTLTSTSNDGPLANSNIRTVVFEEGILNIPSYMCYNCKTLTSVTIPEGVFKIGSYAFAYTAISSIELPESATEIGSRSFSDCTLLTGIEIKDNVTTIGSSAFNGCSKLSSVVIGTSVTKINDYAFSGCSRLASIDLVNVEYLGDNIFNGCTSLTSLTIPNTLTSTSSDGPLANSNIRTVVFEEGILNIPGYMCYNCKTLTSVTIPEGVFKIGSYAFYNTAISSIELPESATEIGSRSFSDCTLLTGIEIKDNVTTIGSSAFNGCSKLSSVIIGTSVTKINDYAFYGCSRLPSIDLVNVEYLGDNIFNGCTSLTSLTIPNTLTSTSSDGPLANSNIRTVVFEEGILNIPNYMCYNCKTLTSVTIPEGVFKIGSYAFYNTAISSIELPESATEIGSRTFCGCTLLTGIEIKDNVTSIGSYAFADCSILSSAVIGTSVTKINDYAFYGCSRLPSIDLANVEYLGGNVFNGCTSLTSLTIPNTLTSTSSDGPLANSNIATVTFEAGIPDIPRYTCRNCATLKEVYIPKSVYEIDNYAFSGCTGLTDVYYEGTEEEWNLITIGNNNEPLLSATIHFGWNPHTTHSYVAVVTPPTCKDNGYTTYTCSVCNESYVADVVPATGAHVYAKVVEEKAATCTEDGYVTKACGCGAMNTTSTPSTGHSYIDFVTESGCVEQGYTTHQCTICGNQYVDSYVPAKGHTPGEIVIENSTAATCLEYGSYEEVIYCDVCWGEISREMRVEPAKGHTEVEIEDIPATCTSTGRTDGMMCSVCGVFTVAPSEIPMVPHTEVVVKGTVATCTRTGLTEGKKCSVCGTVTVEQEVIPAKGHTRGMTVIENSTAATCGQAGSYDEVIYCLRCNYELSRKTVRVDEVPHAYVGVETKAPTCINDGEITYTCSACGDSYKDVIDSIGHDYDAKVIAPTCTTGGYTTYTCTRCGDTYKADETPAKGHNFVGGVCTDCGEKESTDVTDEPKIVVSQKSLAIVGKQVQVAISLENNPGITSMLLKVSYDTSKLELVSVADGGKLGAATHSDVLGSPYTLCWANDTATENIIFNGEVVVLTFNIFENAELGQTPVTVSYNYDDYEIIDKDMKPIDFKIISGIIDIIDVIIGDVNEDSKINQLDRVVLTRYLANWDGYTEDSLNMVAADVNCDGKVNQLDRVILTRCIANWEGYETLPYKK